MKNIKFVELISLIKAFQFIFVFISEFSFRIRVIVSCSWN